MRQAARGKLIARPSRTRTTSPIHPGGLMEPATLTPDLLLEARDGVARLTLNRPERRNALSRDLLARLDDILTEIAANSALRVVVLGARGPVFCSGHDLGEMVGCPDPPYRELFGLCASVMQP